MLRLITTDQKKQTEKKKPQHQTAIRHRHLQKMIFLTDDSRHEDLWEIEARLLKRTFSILK